MKNVYFNHDGNVDDLVSLLLLLQVPDINLTGVSVVDGDGVIEPSTDASRKIIDLFNQHGHKLAVAMSDSRAHHQFPSNWRTGSYAFDAFPMLNEHGNVPTTPIAPLPAHLDMVEKINAVDGKTTLVMTGPITDLARALDADPPLKKKSSACTGWVARSMATATCLTLALMARLSGMPSGTPRR